MCAEIQREVNTYTVDELRQRVLVLVWHLLTIEREAVRDDEPRYQQMEDQAEGRRGGIESGDARRQKAATIGAEIVNIGKGKVTREAIRLYYEENDPRWVSSTKAQRQRKIEYRLSCLRPKPHTKRHKRAKPPSLRFSSGQHKPTN